MVMVDKGRNVQNSDVIDLNRPHKLLSICMCGKDDDYMIDFRYRITMTVNHLARSIKNLGQQDAVEILVTDWGSVVPMAHTLELSPEAAEVCRFIYVSPDAICDTQEGKDSFHTPKALNVAFRRASGKFIIFYCADTLIQEHSLGQILRLLSGEIYLPVSVERTFFMIPRIDVPWQFLERRPHLEEWDRYLCLFAKSTPLERIKWFSFFGGSGALMMHYSMCRELRGVDERYGGWGFTDMDLGMRVSQNYPWLSLSALGVLLFHMEHPPGSRQSKLSKINPQHFNTVLHVNDKDWGLGGYELEIQAPQIRCSSELLEYKSGQHEPESIESWPQSLGEIASELTNSQLVKTIKRMVMSCFSRGLMVDHEALNNLFFLAWYSHNHYPRRYLEFSSESSGAVAVAAICPSVEIYKIGHWEGIKPDDSPFTFIDMLDTFQFRGYARFVNGEISTAIQRLRDSFVGQFGFDLVLVGGKMVGEVADGQICNLISDLSPGGALILSCPSANDFMRIWQKIKDNYGQYTYFQCVDRKTGMVLAVKLRNYHDDQARQIVDVTFDTGWFALTRINARFLKIIRELYRRFIRLFRRNS